MNSALSIRTMRPGELELALEWARQEGWNPGLDDAHAFHAADPSGFLVGTIGEVPVACISVVKYGDSFAFVGLYIVHPEFRGKGHGKAVWDAGMASAAGRTVGLDGVVERQSDYRRAGFEVAYRTMRYGGIVANPSQAGADVLPVSAELLDEISHYDAGIFPAMRASFLTEWCGSQEKRRTFVVRGEAGIRGYGTIRRCFEGFKIGPLFADDRQAAEALIGTLLREAKGQRVYIDVPAENDEAVRLVAALGLEPGFETARMYRGPAPAIPLERVFGTTTLELG
ncbi:GNAT family N-acetyltransferase [Rhizobium sp. BK251]|uniref:GNAT family N-acetyltransferase n=1 Tax=Rhizobium sp. BK251 TaxID=2512125 RepID=UPI0010508430|nr:GNAT family N-acetyltransferase [Rhizobium sp. BK251]TCL65121.1 hypothetical protein EV286_11316 [Rhizobium sp. BK251]